MRISNELSVGLPGGVGRAGEHVFQEVTLPYVSPPQTVRAQYNDHIVWRNSADKEIYTNKQTNKCI